MRTNEMAKFLYDHEINFSISCFWDGGFTSRLGDEMNGWGREHNTYTFPEAMAAIYFDGKELIMEHQRCAVSQGVDE